MPDGAALQAPAVGQGAARRTVLLTLGRLPKALDIARSFDAAGWRVVIAEPFKRHLAGASRSVARSHVVAAPAEAPRRYLEELAAVVAAEGAELVVPVSEETLHVAHLPPLLPAGVRVLTMTPELVLGLHDKGGFVRRAAAMGLEVPESAALGSAEGAALAASGKVVVKPLHSCSGRGVRIVAPGAALPAADAAEPCLVQRFVAGEERSTCTIARRGAVLATAVYRGAMMSGTVAIAFERVEDRAIEDWVARFVAATGWDGFVSFDFVVEASGRAVAIECNPRTTSGLHFLETADIAPALLGTGGAPRFRPERRLQQFYSTLTETQAAMLRRRDFRRSLGVLVRTPDVTWSWRDPQPFLTMTWTAWPIIRESLRRGATFGEVATLDLSWRGPG